MAGEIPFEEHNCRTCAHRDVSLFNQPCSSCKAAVAGAHHSNWTPRASDKVIDLHPALAAQQHVHTGPAHSKFASARTVPLGGEMPDAPPTRGEQDCTGCTSHDLCIASGNCAKRLFQEIAELDPQRCPTCPGTGCSRPCELDPWEDSGPTTTHRSAADILDAMAHTFRERNKVYGSNYKMVAPLVKVLFPDGVPPELVVTHQWHLFELMLVKLSRFAISNLTHQDSIHDAGVYAAMCEMIITNKENEA